MIKFLSSSRITVVCLFLLFILTFWGTIAQVQQGLYAAQDRFFNSFFFLAAGFIPFENKDFSIEVEKFYPNSGLAGDVLVPKPVMKDREDDSAGGVFNLSFANNSHTLILYGAEAQATSVMIAGKTYYFILRHKQYPLPFTIRLDRFKAEFHPGTNMAKSYESTATISTGPLQRRARIFMNNPLRYKDYTLFQASYDTDHRGRQYSTLAVVRNSARILPYIGGLVVFLGLALHFLIKAFIAKAKA